MRKTALLAALAVALAHPPAEASSCRGNSCPQWLSAIGYTFLAGIASGYAYGTGTFVVRDLTDQTQSLEYGIAEVTFNGLAGTAFAAGTLDAIGNGRTGTALVLGSFTVLHGTLTAHGVWRTAQERGDLKMPMYSAAWIGGSLYGINALYWASEWPDRHGRAYGITEVAINAPIAAGLGYLAADRFSSSRGGPGLLYGGMALVSGAFVYHGVRTAIAPPKAPKLDLLGTDVMPTVVSDGIELAPGLGTAGTW